MTTWIGLGLALVFGLVAVHRGLRRQVPGSVMAAGMALMAPGMAGIGPTLVSGPWWAVGFAAVAVWPLIRPSGGTGGVSGRGGAPIPHLLCGVTMIYMCALPTMPTMGDGEAASVTHHITAAPSGQAMAGMGPIDLAGVPIIVPGPLGVAAALLGWALACYFLLGTITALTRRDARGGSTITRLAALDEAAMGFGTVVMLIAFT
jgi:Domain of unknown function (DUF5134)